MFNIYKLHSGNNNHYHKHDIKVTEIKAPTDESVRIYKELEEKAKENLEAVWKMENNLIKDIYIFQYGIWNDKKQFLVRFNINGTVHKIKIEQNLSEAIRSKIFTEEFANKMVNEVAKYITVAMLQRAESVDVKPNEIPENGDPEYIKN